MGILTFGNDGPNIKEVDILQFEQKYRINLPEDYRHFLLNRTGSLEGVYWFDSIDEDDYVLNCELEALYALNDVEIYWDIHMELCEEFGEVDYPDPECFHCIGLANGGNNLFMGFEKEYFGKIYLLYYEVYSHFHLIANSFTEFVEMLRPPEESEEEGVQ